MEKTIKTTEKDAKMKIPRVTSFDGILFVDIQVVTNLLNEARKFIEYFDENPCNQETAIALLDKAKEINKSIENRMKPKNDSRTEQ